MAAAGHVVICVVTGARPEVSLMTAISLLRLQVKLMTSAKPIRADMHFVTDLNEALQRAAETGDESAGVLVCDGTMGFDAQFALRALETDVPVLVGVCPLPVVDWKRVESQPSNEDPSAWGNVYNVEPVPGAPADPTTGYVEVQPTAHLGLLWLRASVLSDIGARHPEVVAGEGGAAFACAGKYDGRTLSAHRRFLELYGGRVLADPCAGASSSGPTEFGGCVGARSVLR